MLLRYVKPNVGAAVVAWIVGAAVPMSAQLSGVKTVFVIALENHDWSEFKGAANAPYINKTLLPLASYANHYYTPSGVYPSLPNYLWREAGTNFGIKNDDDPSSNHQSTTTHLVTQLKNAGISWKTYQEDISGKDCPLTSVNRYAPKHNAFVYFDDVTNANDPSSIYCIAHVRPFTEMAHDLENNTVANYIFITPNLCNCGHDTCAPVNDPVRQTDNWLAANIPMILNSTAYKSGGAVFISWDEGSTGAAPIGLIVLSPYGKGGGYANAVPYTHGSLLRTLEEIFGVPLIRDAALQTDLSDLFATMTRLTATGRNQQVTLSWNPIAGATTYNVKRGTASGGPYGTLIASGIAATTYTDTKVVNGTTYYYVVTGISSSGETSNSNEAAAAPTAAPVINAVVNAASFRASSAAAPGSIITLFGGGFGTQDNLYSFPSTNVNGVSVRFGGSPAPMFALSGTGGQINVLVPSELPSIGIDLTIAAPAGVSSAQTLNVVPAAPGIFFYTDPQLHTRRNAVAVAANTAWIAMPSSMAANLGLPVNCSELGAAVVCGQPAHPGDYLQIYVTGLGEATSNGDPNGAPLPTGRVAPASGNPLYLTTLTPDVTIGGQPAPALFSGIAPGYSGLYQLNVQIPAATPPGDDVPIQITMAGVSDLATIAVR